MHGRYSEMLAPVLCPHHLHPSQPRTLAGEGRLPLAICHLLIPCLWQAPARFSLQEVVLEVPLFYDKNEVYLNGGVRAAWSSQHGIGGHIHRQSPPVNLLLGFSGLSITSSI